MKVPESLKLAAVYYFGSLRNGIIAAKRKPRIGSVWTRVKITAELKRMHSAKQSLTYGSIRRGYPRLIGAAEKHFGGWGNALFAAGIYPKPYYVHLKWRRPKHAVSDTKWLAI